MDIVPYDQKWYPVNQVQKLTQRKVGKIWFFQKSFKQSENFYCNTDQNFCVLSDNVLGDTSLYYTQEVSVTLSLLNFRSYSALIQKNTIIFHQIDFVANFPLHILIKGSSQTFLVTSQFFKFFAEIPHIEAERHLSKNSF